MNIKSDHADNEMNKENKNTITKNGNMVQISFKDNPFFIKSSLLW